MRYKQLVKPNVHITAPPGWCLTYVQNTFNAPWAGSTATDGWNRSRHKHVGQVPPEGVSAPVWFAMEGVPAGHVVTWMEDGSIWSASDNDPQPDYHPDLQHLLDFYGGRLTLRGWSEDIGGLRVVKPVEEEDTMNRRQVDNLYLGVFGRHVDPSGLKTYVGKDWDKAMTDLRESKEFKQRQDIVEERYPAAMRRIRELEKALAHRDPVAKPNPSNVTPVELKPGIYKVK